MKKTKSAKNTAICRDILRYGGDILLSDTFQQAAGETHHLHGSVADHTLNVCIISVWLSRKLENRNIRIGKKDLVQAALCHDLGMVSRDKKYRSRKDAWRSHAKESVLVAYTLIPDMNSSVEDMILTHMWPVTGPHPRSREGMLLGTADKIASLTDWVSWLTGRPFELNIKNELKKKNPLLLKP